MYSRGTSTGVVPFTWPRRQLRRQTRQRLFALPKSPVGGALSINGNTGNAGVAVLQVQWKATLVIHCLRSFLIIISLHALTTTHI